MAARTIGKLTSLAVTLEDAQAALPTPTVVGDGASIITWHDGDSRTGRPGTYAPEKARVAIDVSAPITLTNPVRVFGWDNADAVWRAIKTLNGGLDIVLAVALGFDEDVEGAALYDRLAVGSNGQTGVGNSTVVATPLEIVAEV